MWISVPPVEGGIVVNIADCMMRWSNDVRTHTLPRGATFRVPVGRSASTLRWHMARASQSSPEGLPISRLRLISCAALQVLRSTPHRILDDPRSEGEIAAERYSIAFFCNPNKETMVECLPGCSSEDNPPKYPPINAYDYITMRLAGTIEES